MTRLVALAFAVATVGCAGGAALPFAGGASVGAAIAAARDADMAIATARPFKAIACDVELERPHGPVMLAALRSYCANLPSSVAGAAVTWAKVFAAIADAEGAAP